MIRYTLDGGVPGLGSPAYTAPIRLELGQSVRAATFGVQGRPLSAPQRFDATPAALLTRDSVGLEICPNPAGIRLRVALHPDMAADAPAYNLNIFDTCWLYRQAPVGEVEGVTVTLGRLARHYALREPQRRSVVWRYNPTRHGTVVVRLGACDGPVVASMPIPDPARSPNRLTLSGKLSAPAGTAEADLCLLTIPPEDGPIYGIKTMKLMRSR